MYNQLNNNTSVIVLVLQLTATTPSAVTAIPVQLRPAKPENIYFYILPKQKMSKNIIMK